ncbi:MAG: hypothetical protein AAFS01_00215 [Pseudomonadota bacterium]
MRRAKQQAAPTKGGADAPLAPRTTSVKTGHGRRSLALPPVARNGPPAPSLVLGLHGGNGTAHSFALRSGLTEASHAYGLDIAFPQARRHWSDGRPPLEDGWVADRDFIDELRTRAGKALKRDAVPFAIIGSSNGGIFAQRYAAETSNPPTLTVAVASSFSEAVATRTQSGPPATMMLIQGSADAIIPWDGGDVLDIGGFTVKGRLLSVMDTVTFWKRRNGITAAPRKKSYRLSGHVVRVSYWKAGPGGADLWFVVIDGGSHRLLDSETAPHRPGSLADFIVRAAHWYLDPARNTDSVRA